MDIPGLKFSENEALLLASLFPDRDRPPLDADTLRDRLKEAGYGDWFCFEEAVAKLVDAYNLPDSALGQGQEQGLEWVLAERRDGRFSLEISTDALFAWVNFVPAYGGQAVTANDIFTAFGEAGLTYGIDQVAIEKVCAATAPERITAASGLAAQNGENTRFELLVADTRNRIPQVDARGLIDFRELGAIPLVVAEQALMRRIPPTQGVGGYNVHGEPLDPVPGRNEAFVNHLVGAYIDPNDPNLLRATFNGQPVRCGNGVMVEQVLRVRNVNIASGNITFDGTVHVDGEVLPGMKVHSTGDIIVTGVVDGGELEAGGDIHVGGGIIAQARVKAAGSVAARFVENAHVYSGTTIAVDDMVLQSDLQAMNQIVIGIKAKQRGRLTGGSTRAMLLVQVPVLGTPTGGLTHVQLGVNPVLEAKYEDLLLRIEKQKANEENLEKLVKHLSTHGEKGSKGGMLERAKASWQQAVQVWARLLPERDDLEAQLALVAGAHLEVSVGVAGSVDVSFGKKGLRLRQNFEAGAFSIGEGGKVIFTDRASHVLLLG
jgi:uncharacterized protein (DUF342 family)